MGSAFSEASARSRRARHSMKATTQLPAFWIISLPRALDPKQKHPSQTRACRRHVWRSCAGAESSGTQSAREIGDAGFVPACFGVDELKLWDGGADAWRMEPES